MTKQKIKLSLIDDYISLFKILNFCVNGEDFSGNFNLELANLKIACENAIARFEKKFVEIKMADLSLKIVQNELNYACFNPIPSKKIVVEQSKNYQNILNKINLNFNKKISQIL